MNATQTIPPTTTTAPAYDDLRSLLVDWSRSLRATNRAPSTIASYLRCAENLIDYLTAHGMPTTASGIAREHLEAFLADMLDRLSPATTAKHFRSLQQLWKFLETEGEITASPMRNMRPPAVPEVPVPVIPDTDRDALLATCKATTFEQRRDQAILRLLLDTGIRSAELVGLKVEDHDLDPTGGTVVVMGKGRRPRGVPIGNRTAVALSRYVRVRRSHLHNASAALFIGRKGPLTDSGLRQMLERRCDDAGIGHLHPHQFRHTAAHAWLAADGSETGLMRNMGWRSREMVGRYAASAASERAQAEHRRKALGDKY